MKNKTRLAIVIAVLALSAALGACAKGGSKNQNSTVSSSVSVSVSVSQDSTSSVSQISAASEVSGEESQESGETSAASEVSQVSQESESSEEESSNVQVSEEESSELSETEPSEESTDTSETVQGYYFDDEQIIEDYHHATEFTDDEAFNELFAGNDIDKAYNDELKMAESTLEMRSITQKYADQWKSEQQEAYLKLYDQLQELPEEQEKLVESQNSWNSQLDTELQKFLDEASGSGSNGVLAADSAILNYYKGRAAVLYHQIYLLTGSFDMN